MDLLIDTNVFLDLYCVRRDYDAANRAFIRLLQDGDSAFVSASSLTDMFYIVRKKAKSTARAYEVLDEVCAVADILPVDPDDITQARALDWKDFEDALQLTVAMNNGMDGIITNDTDDFESTPIPVMKPLEYSER